MESISLPPSAAALMESTRSIGYSLEAAVADIIDNSIAANAEAVEVNFFPVNSPYIAIADNGIGMTMEDLTSAMQYGSKNPLDRRDENDLGRYGLGLKTASLSQCQVLTVVSKKYGELSCCRWDLRHIRKTNEWELLVLNDQEIKKLPCIDFLENRTSGTIVIWQELDRLIASGDEQKDVLGNRMIRVREHLSLVFHRFLSGADTPIKVSMTMNNEKITPNDPFRYGTKAMDEEKIFVRDLQEVKVKPFVLPHTSKLSAKTLAELGGKDGLRKTQGFYVYRAQRLVVWGTWFRMMVKGEFSKLARIQVDIPNTLDDLWTLDIKKSTAIPPEEVQNNLRLIINKVAETSKRTWTFRGKKETSDNIEHIWNRLKTRNSGIVYEINRQHAVIQQLLNEGGQVKSRVEMLLKNIERSIPLNQLYIDLNNDEKIENDSEVEEQEILKTLEQMLAFMPGKNERIEFLQKLEHTEPFCGYPELLQKMISKEEE